MDIFFEREFAKTYFPIREVAIGSTQSLSEYVNNTYPCVADVPAAVHEGHLGLAVYTVIPNIQRDTL